MVLKRAARAFGLVALPAILAVALGGPALAAGAPLPPGPFVPEPGIKGYGVRGVPGETLADMLDSCRAGRDKDALEAERCDQLLRSLHTQPGNAMGRR